MWYISKQRLVTQSFPPRRYAAFFWYAASIALLAHAGCGSPDPAAAPQPAPIQLRAAADGSSPPAPAPAQPPLNGASDRAAATPPDSLPPAIEVAKPPRSLGNLAGDGATAGGFDQPLPQAKPMQIDPGKVKAAGIRVLTGKHITLYTDLPSSPAVDELPAIFDAAVPQWATYFEVPAARTAGFKMSGFLMQEKNRFRGAGLLPAALPDFPNGLQSGHEFWLNEQKEDYYRRHLFLHEGCHGFMTLLLGGAGPPWYMEGLAEYTATHQWANGQLQLMVNPPAKEEAPGWGRVRMIQDLYAEGQLLTLDDIMQFDSRAHMRNEPYAWCWAAVTFLQNHPLTAEAFSALRSQVANRTPAFSTRFRQQLAADWPRITEAWQLFIVKMQYGYSVKREAVVYTKGAARLPSAGAAETARLQADRGWQSTGIKLQPATTYTITASGRYQIGTQPQIWWSEPPGVTLEYHDGVPRGMIVAALHNDENPLSGGVTPLLKSIKLGSGRQLTSGPGGVLYVRVNEAGNSLADNAGQFTISVKRVP